MTTLTIDAVSSRRAAQLFNLGSVVAVTFVPLLMIWIGASMYVYASMANHPNDKVAAYNRWAGYRFYGTAGFLMVFGSPIYSIFNNWVGLVVVWSTMFIVVVPWGILSIVRAHRDDWSEISVEVVEAPA